MKANELMQGDIVLYEYDGQKFPAKVIEIYRNSVLAESINGEYEPIEIEEDKIFPVSLTPEILEKNGLKPDTVEDAYKYCYKKDDVSIVECYANAGGRFRGIFSFGDTRLRITLRFVHQLQHCLRLVGIEKDITL